MPQPLNADAIESIDQEQLAALIRPSGYYNQKAIKLKALLAWFKQYDYDDSRLIPISVDALRKELLEIKGVGNETADVILTYALNKPLL
ncbi:endonuclease III [Vibrio astriarenae]|nr:endonuclease III [Vibrio sp. C7]